MALRIVFPEQDKVELEEVYPERLRSGCVRVRTTVSLISAGTEGIALHKRFDEGSHWAAYVRYPFHPGYAAIGVVEEIGTGVRGLSIGDRVASRSNHASEYVLEAERCTVVPEDIPLENAVWFALAKIALVGARVADYKLGDRVAVVGAGPIGQMSVRWAVAAGCRSIVAIDTPASRLEHARRGGASATVLLPAAEAKDGVLTGSGGVLPRVVVDTTGNATAFASSLGLAADFGRLVLLGDSGWPRSQHLTSDVMSRGVMVVGAHDSYNRRAPGWETDEDMHDLFFRLVQARRLNVEGLITHSVSPTDAKAAYDLATVSTGDSMGVAFDWLGT